MDTLQEFLWIIAGIWAIFMGWLFIPSLIRGGSMPEKFSRIYIRRLFLIGIFTIALFIFGSRADPGIFLERFVPDSVAAGIAGVDLPVLGLGFSSYARLHLGRNWSSMVMIKEGHQLIRTGPYRFVRNPMYTGLLTAFIGLVIAIGILAALAALVVLVVSLWIKITSEEELLLETFGDEYRQYWGEVKAIIPFVL